MNYPPAPFDSVPRRPTLSHTLTDDTLVPDDQKHKLSPLHSFDTDTDADTFSPHPLTVSVQQPRSRPSLWKAIIPDSIPCRLYILVLVLQTVVDLIIEGVLMIKYDQLSDIDQTLKTSSSRRLPVFFSIFGFAHVFQLILAVDAVWMRNTLQFFFLTFFNLVLLVYAIVQIFEIRSALNVATRQAQTAIIDTPIHTLLIVIPVVIAVAECAYVFLGWSIWREFGWKVYKHLGADRRIRKMYMQYQILLCFMKFDVFFFAGFSIQLIFLVLQRTNTEYYITVAALPASLLVLVAGHLSARYEHRGLMYAFMASCVGACGYFGFKLFRIIQQRSEANFQLAFKTLTAFAVIAILFLVLTFIWACIVLRNFGCGLRAHLSKNKDRQGSNLKRALTQRTHRTDDPQQFQYNAKRMSLD